LFKFIDCLTQETCLAHINIFDLIIRVLTRDQTADRGQLFGPWLTFSWFLSKFTCCLSAINSSSFDSTFWINPPLRRRLLSDEDN